MNADERRNTRLLVVDDAPAFRLAMRALLQSSGYALIGELASGTPLLPTIDRLRPDIVCLDYYLPDQNGLALLNTLRASHPEVAVVMITGSNDAELEARAAECGAAGFLRKPFSPGQVIAVIDQVRWAQLLFRRHRVKCVAAPDGQVSLLPARARAVVVDDSATMRRLLCAILDHAQIEVVGEAVDGREAIEVVARWRPQVVCLDVDMPGMDGLTALPQLRAGSPQSRVLMVTARAGRERVLAAAKAGASGYILKPFAPERVIEALGHVLAGR